MAYLGLLTITTVSVVSSLTVLNIQQQLDKSLIEVPMCTVNLYSYARICWVTCKEI